MKYSVTGVITYILLELLPLQNRATQAYTRKFDETVVNSVSGITFNHSISFGANQTVTIWTEQLVAIGSCAPDPVIHIRPLTGPAIPAQSNDDCNIAGVTTGRNSCIRFTNTSGSSGSVALFAHGYTTCSASTGTVRVTRTNGGSSTTSYVTMGGHVLMLDVGWTAGEKVQIVRPPDSLSLFGNYRALLTRRDGACSYNDVKLVATSVTGIAGGAQITAPTSSAGGCSARIVVGSSWPSDVARQARVYVNDVSPDPDGDGLGSELELAIGTCEQKPGGYGSCAYARNAIDSDFDGLWDGWELLGRDLGALRLPAWGASPRHKDLFIELDWNVDDYPSNPFTESGLDQAAAPYRAGGSSLPNPDGVPGISLHFDAGISTCEPTQLVNCSTLFGNWGGSNATSAARGYLAHPGNMSTTRNGVFLYGLSCEDNCGAAFLDAAPRSVDFSSTGARILAHEVGHLLGIDHYGEYEQGGSTPRTHNCEPNYLSIMNYAYEGLPYIGFSFGTMPNLVSSQGPGRNYVAILVRA